METKICNTCDIEKDAVDFSRRSDTGGLRSDCILCRRAKYKKYREENKDEMNARHRDRYTWDDNYRYKDHNDHARERKRKNYHAQKRKHQVWRMENLYGLSLHQYEEMYESQNASCKLCDKFIHHLFEEVHYDKKANVDHCHRTGEIRGLLCGRCNKGLGLFLDNEESLLKAVKYLQGKLT